MNIILLLLLTLQPWVGLGLFDNSIPHLSILNFTIQPVIFILLRSSSTWSIHLNLDLPTGLVLCGFHSVIFLAVLVFSNLITWATHLSLCDFINFIISSCFILCLNSSFVLIPHVPSGNMNITYRELSPTAVQEGPSWYRLAWFAVRLYVVYS